MKGLTKIFGLLIHPEKSRQEESPGSEREEQLAELALEWDIWDPTKIPPVGWRWLKDNVLDSWCLVRYNRGRLDRITRREWYKAFRRVHRKINPTPPGAE